MKTNQSTDTPFTTNQWTYVINLETGFVGSLTNIEIRGDFWSQRSGQVRHNIVIDDGTGSSTNGYNANLMILDGIFNGPATATDDETCTTRGVAGPRPGVVFRALGGQDRYTLKKFRELDAIYTVQTDTLTVDYIVSDAPPVPRGNTFATDTGTLAISNTRARNRDEFDHRGRYFMPRIYRTSTSTRYDEIFGLTLRYKPMRASREDSP